MIRGLVRTGRTRARQALSDAERFREVLRLVALVVIAWSLAVSWWTYPHSAAIGLIIAAPAVVVAAMVLRRDRALVLAVAAGFACYFTPDAVTLWPTAAATAYLSVSHDQREIPGPAILSSFIGAVASLVAFRYAPSVAPFLAGALGIGIGLFERRLSRIEDETASLRRRTQVSEAQTVWLEQRTALARELHDVVGHHVTAMVVQAEAGLVDQPRQALHAIGGLGRKALSELDALVVHLRDPDAQLSVSAPPRLSDIDELLAAPLRHQGVVVEVRLDDSVSEGKELDEVGLLTVYRIAQEALTNVARHARATTAWVELARAGRHVRLRVADDGVGPPDVPERGAGLVGIEERVAAAGGMWSMSQRPGGGTIVDAYLPLAATPA